MPERNENSTMKTNLNSLARDYDRVESAIHYLEAHVEDQPELEDVADHVGLSTTHFQRVFSRWAGISPKRFLQYLTLRYTKEALRQSEQSLLETTFSSGLSSVSRLHDLYVHCEAMTPAEYRTAGRGLEVNYGVQPTPFGRCVIGLTERGLCGLQFVQADDERQAVDVLKKNWPFATFNEDDKRTRAVCNQIFSSSSSFDQPLYTLIKGTPFQLKVWEALLSIPGGRVASYNAVADSIGQPGAARAVANAIASNPLHYLIPCHRVIRNTGALGGYRGGMVRKRILLGWEAAQYAETGSFQG
jgi:AraC family transcriptional regulator of adaptative response/methylated-DNA-[protein]-cysteine methyltransferase